MWVSTTCRSASISEVLEVARTIEQLKAQGALRAAQKLEEKVTIAEACCDVAPKLLMGLKLEPLRALLRILVGNKVRVPVEVWLRLWSLQSVRLIVPKDMSQLQRHIRMWRLKDITSPETVDRVNSPYLSLLLDLVKHKIASELAGADFAEVFFSDEVMMLMQKKSPLI